MCRQWRGRSHSKWRQHAPSNKHPWCGTGKRSQSTAEAGMAAVLLHYQTMMEFDCCLLHVRFVQGKNNQNDSLLPYKTNRTWYSVPRTGIIRQRLRGCSRRRTAALPGYFSRRNPASRHTVGLHCKSPLCRWHQDRVITRSPNSPVRPGYKLFAGAFSVL